MAAISTLQSSSIQSTINQLDWTDNGEVNTLKRAPHGGTYATIATVTGLATYQDTAAIAGTYYDYKITSGVSGDSNVSSVVTQVCDNVGAPPTGALAGQYAQGEVTPQDFNNLIDDLNKVLQPENNQLFACEVCPTNGAVVLDCGQCSNFIVSVTTDINSISMIGCQNVGDGTIDFLIPGGTTKKVCGFPQSLGFDGSECSKNPGSLSGGTSGVSHRVSFGGRALARATRQLTSKGKTGGAPRGLALTLTCKTSTGGTNSNCSMDCSGVKSMQVVATGGVPPYSFSVTGGLGKSVAGSTATLTPPANGGSGVAGTAFRRGKWHKNCNDGLNAMHTADYLCDDSQTGGNIITPSCSNSFYGPTGPGGCAVCTLAHAGDFPTLDHLGASGCNPPATFDISSAGICDMRSAAMIASGCVPCGISVPGKIVTVTDATGATVSKTINV